MNLIEKRELEERIIDTLKIIYDPEIPVNIYEIGLIYEIKIEDNANVHILMTLTTPNCPVAESLPVEVKEAIAQIKGINNVEVELTFDPPWSEDMLSDEAKLELGFL